MLFKLSFVQSLGGSGNCEIVVLLSRLVELLISMQLFMDSAILNCNRNNGVLLCGNRFGLGIDFLYA